ncbi:hypothetical protein ACUH9X_08280 [Dermabacteraceae bacterium P13147]
MSSGKPWQGGGREVPELRGRECWEIGNLAQMPGTRLTALSLAREVISTIPAGVVIVATPANERLRGFYARFGFKPGSGRQMHMIAPAAGRRPLSIRDNP